MKKLFTFLFISILFIPVKGQDVRSVIQELKKTFKNYYLNTSSNYQYQCENEVRINYEEPVITIQFIITQRNNYETIINESKVTFDVLKSIFYKPYYSSYNTNKGRVEIRNSSGIEVFTRRQWISAFTSSKPTDKKETKLLNEYYYDSEQPVVDRLYNAFTNLQTIAKEKGVKKTTPNILDNAELAVQDISFVAPDNTGKIKANQTGCIKVEVKNINSNNALNVACIVREQNKSELFSYEQYTSVDKINGNETEVINIPIKASENVDNSTYPFEVMVTYNGKTIKTQTLNITASNPKKQQSASSTSGSSRNKTVRMRKMTGNTYLISCKVNGLPLDFIFDTGASSVTLSRKQAVFMLKNGYLSKSDIVGSSAYQTASGDIAIGTVIKLKKIDINGLILNNVEASIINSDSAPLLLGQSALSRLGKIQIDYKNSTLTIIR